METSTGAPTTASRVVLRLVENAREHLGGEDVLAVFRGQTLVSPVMLPLVGSVLGMAVAKPRAVIVTNVAGDCSDEHVEPIDGGAARLLPRLWFRAGEGHSLGTEDRRRRHHLCAA